MDPINAPIPPLAYDESKSKQWHTAYMRAQDQKFDERIRKMMRDFRIANENEKIVVRKCEPLTKSLMGSDYEGSSDNVAADDKEDSGPTDESAIDVNSNNSSYDRGDFINEEIHNRYLSL